MVYEIKVTARFKEVYEALDGSEKQWIDNIKLKLRENPAGKILRFGWFREKKYLNKRLYYLVDDNFKRILLIAFASKKEQQKVIDYIMNNMDLFLQILKN